MLSYFQWYRRWRGGKWAKVTNPLGLFCQRRWIKVPDSTVERVDEDYTPKILTLPNPWSVVDGKGRVVSQSASRSRALDSQWDLLNNYGYGYNEKEPPLFEPPLTITNELEWLRE